MGTTLLYQRACKNALTDIYFDLGACDKLMKQHPDWGWVKEKKTKLEKQEQEIKSELAILNFDSNAKL